MDFSHNSFMDFSHNSFCFMESTKMPRTPAWVLFQTASRGGFCICSHMFTFWEKCSKDRGSLNDIRFDVNSFWCELWPWILYFVFTCNAFSEDVWVCRIVWYRHNDGQYWGNGGLELGQVSPLLDVFLFLMSPCISFTWRGNIVKEASAIATPPTTSPSDIVVDNFRDV